MCSPDPKGGQARNYDENNVAHREALDHLYPRHPWVFDSKRRRLLLKGIITGIAVSPWAPEMVVNEVKHDWASIGDLKLPIHHVSSSLIPSPEDLAIHGGIGCLPQKPAAVARALSTSPVMKPMPPIRLSSSEVAGNSGTDRAEVEAEGPHKSSGKFA
jgi:hypothetical protein